MQVPDSVEEGVASFHISTEKNLAVLVRSNKDPGISILQPFSFFERLFVVLLAEFHLATDRWIFALDVGSATHTKIARVVFVRTAKPRK